ncbi:MAG: hypothetical protein PHU12_02570 [Candidatus Aenigmarchaeota archaeon]|nr:hypothetical protein [Candidatus Aenigmarchaeota archaeon]
MPFFNSDKKKEPKEKYSLDLTGPCGMRQDKCHKYMEYFRKPDARYKSACETCQENPQLE